MGANDQSFIDEFNEQFYKREDSITTRLPSAASITGHKRDMITADYDIQLKAHDDFFTAYVAALKTAFVDLVADNQDLIAVLTDAYHAAVNEVYGVSLASNE